MPFSFKFMKIMISSMVSFWKKDCQTSCYSPFLSFVSFFHNVLWDDILLNIQ